MCAGSSELIETVVVCLTITGSFLIGSIIGLPVSFLIKLNFRLTFEPEMKFSKISEEVEKIE